MFYSETLLSKTGPLARVWLAANVERKVSKNQFLDSNIAHDVNAILDQGQAPLALRLSGQLLLGVVRIYSRKTKYLLEDCNEAILKIKLAFRSGNVDLPAHQGASAAAGDLTMPDVLTELDLLLPPLDTSLLLGGSGSIDNTFGGLDLSLLEVANSQIQKTPARSQKPINRATEAPGLLDDIGLDLDLGFDDTIDRSIEVGRRAPPRLSAADGQDESTALYNGPDLDLDFGGIEPAGPRDSSVLPMPEMNLGDITMGGMDDGLDFQGAGNDLMATPTLNQDGRKRMSPPEDGDAEIERENTTLFEPEESVHHAQRAKKRKILHLDKEIEMHSGQIRALQNDRSKILKPASFLPRDPLLLALMEMQRTGGFVSSLLGDGRSKGWAPELRGILSLEVIRQSQQKKKKREDETTSKRKPEEDIIAQIEDVHIDDMDQGMGIRIDDEQHFDNTGIGEDQTEIYGEPTNNFDHTDYPLVHPQDSGPVSLGTKHAVHLLREQFGPDAAASPGKRQQSTVLFNDLLPERSTTRKDATKMFFEMLVLATKDAIKVDQTSDEIGGPLRIRAKRGLWGAWAENAGDIATQVPAGVAG